ncbi:Retrotransposon Tca5 Polyprotein [Phytophthora megakarya]|uniref:Retrotransposon Tca5 Polyprotein n=1 Tax=Phytophthora megakarya TaxID=4795 RepID=A0A225VQ74_9STRA|nr:Retrotransposon Tca5 Polyprotein [Phytophthora megakarya]
MAPSQRAQWLEAIKEEFLAQVKNETWVLVPRPKRAHVLKNKWLWVLKENGKRLRFKARLVVLGCLQIRGLEFDDTFAPVVRFETLRFVLLHAGMTRAVVKQYDFVTAFLNAPKVIFMEQPEGHVKRGYEDWVCQLQRSIYGLRQSPRNWNSMLHLALVEFGFRRVETRLVLLPIYVDDILLIGCEHDVDFFVDKLVFKSRSSVL